eukprot:gene11558-3437_t
MKATDADELPPKIRVSPLLLQSNDLHPKIRARAAAPGVEDPSLCLPAFVSGLQASQPPYLMPAREPASQPPSLRTATQPPTKGRRKHPLLLEGTKAQRHKGTKAQRHKGTKHKTTF